ncbi:MAG: hypothetical protein J6C37_13055 [Roseburia sp.]|nr:hypothetical protein [Roseburia sp.]
MDQRLSDVLQEKEGNYLFPFYWQRGDHTERIPEQIQKIYDSGCREFCVESKSHPEFCGDGWWRDMDIILKEAEKRGMKVWVLDDDKFPTGHANGVIEKEYPQLRQWNLVERHIDVVGPAQDIAVFSKETNSKEDVLLGAYAYKRVANVHETCNYEAVDLTDQVKGDYLYWDVPEGVWRIFFYYKSRRGGWNHYIDMISAESVRVLIDTVYESHWEHYREHFGKTLVGFFSDEPAFANQIFRAQRVNYGFYEQRIGTPGLALPWNESVWNRMQEKLRFDPTPHLNLLWYNDDCDGDAQAEIRFAYMDAITRLYSECFAKQVSDWCHAHGVMHTGHVIEDMGSHCHLHHSAGHYFRAVQWQDMSGIDIVFQQVLPGMEHYYHTSSAQGVADGEFFHYILGKLGASLAHLNPSMKGRAMCEMFGAYGWGADTSMMKYIIDFLLVRGINRFVPHAFSTKFPDSEFPPHFSAEGMNPSFEGFSVLMKYINRAAHLLDGATHYANAAVLYNAEGEWSSCFMKAMPMQPIATRLYDAHIDYDIVSMDILKTALVKENRLCIGKESFDCLIVPYADHLPLELQKVLEGLHLLGMPVWFFGGMPRNAIFQGFVMEPDALIPTMKSLHMTDVIVDDAYPNLRIYHCCREKNDIFMFFNEDFHKTLDTVVKLPSVGEYVRMDLLNERYCSGETKDGSFGLKLLPNQSVIVIFGDRAGLEEEWELPRGIEISPAFRLDLAHYNELSNYVTVGNYKGFFNVTGPDFFPEFSGKMRYTFSVDVPVGTKRVFLDLGRVGQNALLVVNGSSLGMRVACPYLFEITEVIHEGANQVEVVVSNTLVQQVKDNLSHMLQLAPSGLLGGMRLICC